MNPTINKKDFFKNLLSRVGKKYKMYAGQYLIGFVTVEKSNSVMSTFNVRIEYVGNYRERVERHSLKTDAHIHTFGCHSSWDRLHYADQAYFSRRSLVECEENKVEEVKPNGAVVIIKKPAGQDSIHLKYVHKGVPFWYMGSLYQRTNSDSHNALRLSDGCLCYLNLETKVLPTTIEVNVTGNLP